MVGKAAQDQKLWDPHLIVKFLQWDTASSRLVGTGYMSLDLWWKDTDVIHVQVLNETVTLEPQATATMHHVGENDLPSVPCAWYCHLTLVLSISGCLQILLPVWPRQYFISEITETLSKQIEFHHGQWANHVTVWLENYIYIVHAGEGSSFATACTVPTWMALVHSGHNNKIFKIIPHDFAQLWQCLGQVAATLQAGLQCKNSKLPSMHCTDWFHYRITTCLFYQVIRK